MPPSLASLHKLPDLLKSDLLLLALPHAHVLLSLLKYFHILLLMHHTLFVLQLEYPHLLQHSSLKIGLRDQCIKKRLASPREYKPFMKILPNLFISLFFSLQNRKSLTQNFAMLEFFLSLLVDSLQYPIFFFYPHLDA